MTNRNINKILEEMEQICSIWTKMDDKVKSYYTQDEIWSIYEYIMELRKENTLLKNKIPYIIRNNLCSWTSIKKYKNKICVNYEMQKLKGSDNNE